MIKKIVLNLIVIMYEFNSLVFLTVLNYFFQKLYLIFTTSKKFFFTISLINVYISRTNKPFVS